MGAQKMGDVRYIVVSLHQKNLNSPNTNKYHKR